MNLDPENYHQVSPYDLLVAAARGRIGLDHRFLHGILDDREKTMPDLVRFAAGNLGHYPINLEDDLVAIFRYFRAEEAVPFYLKLIRENPEDINDELIDSLSNLGRPALEPLLQIHEELGEENAGDVPFALSALQVRDPRILGILTARLEYDVSDAALCLEVYGDPEALPALEKTLAEISPDDAALRKTVEDVIETLRAPEESVPDPQPLNIWDIYPETAPPVFDVLSEADRLDMLESSSAGRRKEAAESFLNSQLSPAAKSKLIRLAKSDPDAGVRGRAWESLADESDEPEIRRAMLEIAENPAAPLDERSGAVVGLAQHSDQARVRRLILDLYEKPEGRAKALEAMWRSFDRSFTAYPPRHLHDDDPATRRQAIWGVGQLRISQSAPQLKEFFEDDEYRVDALFNYTLSMPGNVSPGRARAMLEKVEKTAAGLTAGETELVQMAIDQRLVEDGMRPVFHEDLAPEQKQEQPGSAKIGRNDPCPCGSGKKYKKCHGA